MTISADSEIQTALATLVGEGKALLRRCARRLEEGRLLDLEEYQSWYTGSLAVVRQVMPARADEFAELYDAGRGSSTPLDLESHRIKDRLLDRWPRTAKGVDGSNADREAVERQSFLLLRQQVLIIEAVAKHFQTALFDIQALIKRSMFRQELDAARGLAMNGFHRAGGALAGVLLEEQLQDLAESASVSVKKDSNIGQLNDALKAAEVFDLVRWSRVQHLGRLRNLCNHKKEREPTPEEVEEMIDGVAEVIGWRAAASGPESRPA